MVSTHAITKYPLSGALVATKANDFAKQLGMEFECNDGWLHRFKTRHDITLRLVSGEGQSVSLTSVENWKERLPTLLEGYEPRNVYNADETALFWQLIPNKTLAEKGDVCRGGKLSKQRVTVLVMANMDGTDKRKLMVIGRFEKPRCFSGIQKLPVDYKANKKSWMTSSLFQEFVKKFDIEMHHQKRKVLLIVDNCPAHPAMDNLLAVRLVFYPLTLLLIRNQWMLALYAVLKHTIGVNFF
jgi:hypothetical protein